VIASTGQTIHILPGKSVVEVLQQYDIEIEASCRHWMCGACLTGMLEGTPEYRDRLLTERQKARNNQFAACSSRSKSPGPVPDL
jgi:vanillate O-demethylase ferredoxin subunit